MPNLQKDDDNSRPPKQCRVEINLDNLSADPGLLPQIGDYNPNEQDQIHRHYWQKGPFQPRAFDFFQRLFVNKMRRFNKAWFGDFSTWLEYSIKKDAVFYLCCYLFKPEIGDQAGGDSFVCEGFTNWKKKDKLYKHVGGPNSAHNYAWGKCQDLLNQR